MRRALALAAALAAALTLAACDSGTEDSPEAYTVTFDRQGGSGGAESARAVMGQRLPDITVPTKEDLVFYGYWTKENGGGVCYTRRNGKNNRQWDIASDTTLYAMWKDDRTAVSLLDLTGAVTTPAAGAAPDTGAIDTAQYTGTVEWQNADGTAFTGSAFEVYTVYKALVTLTAKSGFTFTGVAANSFTHTGAVSVTNAADSGTVTVTFPATLPALMGTVSITGTAKVGQALAANTASLVYDTSGTLSYQWKADGANVGTNQNAYTPALANYGKTITVTVTASKNSGSVTGAADQAVAGVDLTGAVTITGAAAVGQTLTANTASLVYETSGTLSYQWKAGGANVGTNQSAYTIALADYGKTITVTVTASKNSGSVESAAAGPVSATAASLASVLAGLPANTAGTPHTVPLAAGTNISGSDWAAITSAVQSSGRYVILDLSECSANGNTVTGAYNPSGNNFNIIQNNQYIKGVVLPSTLTSVGNYAFYGCSSLTSVTIRNGVTSIMDRAFSGCTGLTSVIIPAGVTGIGMEAFEGCTGLTSVTIPAGVTGIGAGAFSGCASLTSVTIPGSVTSIGNEAFYFCTGLTSVTIGNGVTSIRQDAFYGSSSLTSVTIPAGVTSIGQTAFGACTSLTSVTFAGSAAVVNSSYAFPSGASLLSAGGAGAGGPPMQAGAYTREPGGSVWTKQ
ncbi:MAG: leucine-rich repeat protein [Treponematales bacterium]